MPTTSEYSPLTRRHLIIPGLVLFAMVPALIRTIIGWGSLLVYPGEANFGEGHLLVETWRLVHGLPLYLDVNRAPWWSPTYPPLFHLVASPLVALGFHLHGMRLISLAASFISAFCLYRISRAAGASRTAAAIAPILWFTSPYADAWSALARTDMLARAFSSLAILALVLRGPTNCRAILLASLLSSLAVFTKQPAIAGGLTCFLLCATRGWRPALRLTLTGFSITALLYSATYVLSNFHLFDNIIGNTARGFNPDQFVYWLLTTLHTHATYFVASGVGIILSWHHRRNPAIAALYFSIISGMPAAVAAGNNGSDRNYYLDFIWPLCALAALAVHHISLARRPHHYLLPAAACLALLWHAQWRAFTFFTHYPTKADRSVARRVIRNLAKAPSPVISEYPAYAILAGRTTEVVPYVLAHLHRADQWSPDATTTAILNKRYGAFLISDNCQSHYPLPLFGAMWKTYHPVKTFDHVYLLEGHRTLYLFRPNP